jgi:glutathione synthase
MKYTLLVVTDHTTHTESNSVYRLCLAMRDDPRCKDVWVCSRGLDENKDFFGGIPDAEIVGSQVSDDFRFEPEGYFFYKEVQQIDRHEIDAILIRMPQPPDPAFLFSLETIVPPSQIINRPDGIMETSSKAFLLELSHLCSEPLLCNSIEHAMVLADMQEIVLKPLYSYGGRGIVRLSADNCWNENERYPISELSSFLNESHFPMLATRFLKIVVMGDKRTIVAYGQILGSALRHPAKGSWMCNVAQGGHAELAEADEDELAIERILTPLLHGKGVIFYGFDTLVDDDGKRVLSEINTLSIGGLTPLDEMSNGNILGRASKLLWDYITLNH